MEINMKAYTNRIISMFCLLFILWSTFTAHSMRPTAKPAGRETASLKVEIVYSSEGVTGPITGRAYFIVSKSDDEVEPRFRVGRGVGSPIWGLSLDALKVDEAVVLDGSVFGFPVESIDDIPAGEYNVQGFINIYSEFRRADGHTLWMHNDQWEGQRWNRSPGNLYSDVQKITIDPARPQTIRLVCDHVIPPVEIPPDTKWVKRIKFESPMLTAFWGRPIYLGATVLLPKGYDEHPDVEYPVVYIQGHFSLRAPFGFSDAEPESENRWARRGYEFYQYWNSDDCPRMIAVTFQHPCPYYDDSYAVNSPNVGPYGDAIMEELIPRVEATFRIIRKPYARLLTGGSTGGWISLALQIFYPDFFGGTWSLCPDPVDFRYYQIVNIYEDENAYFRNLDWIRLERPNCRETDGNIRFFMKDENLTEYVIGDKSRGGGQWDIWEAAYSPIGEDGYPKPIWDKRTGKIDHDVAKTWKEWDLRNILETRWAKLGSKLQGKLHIYTGSMDSFYLNEAVVLLEKFLESTTDPYYDGVIEYGEKKPHCWGPRGKDLLELMKAHLIEHVDPAGDTSAWLY